MSRHAPEKSHRKGIRIVELIEMFPDKRSARTWFESMRWANGRTCPFCRSNQTAPVPNEKPMPYHCEK